MGRNGINFRGNCFFAFYLLQFLHILRQSESQITTSGLTPLDETPTFVISNFGYRLNEVSLQPPLSIEITVGDPAIPGIDLTGFEYEVTWFVEGKKSSRRRKQQVSRQVSSSGNDVVERLGFSSTGNNGYRLGEEIHATFRVRYYRVDSLDSSVVEFSPWSELGTSPTYKTGILIYPVEDNIYMKECSENYTNITVTLKTPVNCPTNNNNCVLGIQIFLERIPGRAFYWTSRQELALSSCQISLDNSHLNKPIDVFLKGICDSFDENNDTVLLRMEFTQSTSFWNSFTLADKKITISDTHSRWCTYQGDPHMQTFDGLSYSYFGIGDFVLYKNKELRLEINARLWPCASRASCICAIAIRENNDVLTLKGCNIKKPWKFGVTLKTVSPSSFSSIQVFKELSTSNTFYIFLSGGAEVIVTHTYNPEVEQSWVNAMMRVPDRGEVHQGMCGNYDGILQNDLGSGGDGVNYTGDPNGFGKSWRLVFNKESWFHKTPTYTPTMQRKMCSCGMRAGWWSNNKPTLATRCSFLEENSFLAVRRPDTEDITESLRANAGRRRRAANSETFLEEASSEGEFDVVDFKDYKEIEILSWPTASGLNQSEVYEYCRGVIFDSSGAQDCQSVKARKRVGNDTALLGNCVKDIQITDQMFWSSSALSIFQSQCHQAVMAEYAEAVANETKTILSDGTQAVLDFMLVIPYEIILTCPGDCSGNGSCTDGLCSCNEGWSGKDCSLRSDQAPVLRGAYSDGLCDIRVRGCKLFRVNGFGFVNSPGSSLSCHVEGFEVFNATWNLTSIPTLTSAQLIDLYQVQCNLLRHPVSRDENPYVGGTPVVGMRLSVSNDGNKTSNKEIIIIYDGLCLSCTVKETCILKNNTCLINGRCYASGHVHSYVATMSCKPDIDSRKWTEVTDIITPRKQGKDTTIIIVAGVVAPLVILLGVAIALRCWIIGARRGGAAFESNGQEDDYFFHY